MGEPVEVLESSDAEIDRLFPKCGPRILTNRNDLNRNCVSDDNDNYEAPLCTTTIEEEVTSLESSASSSSRMSVDSATPSSTPASHSSNGGPAERDADLSVVSAYSRDERFHSVLDSSYEEGPGSPTSHSLPLKRDHFRLRDSRIEAAGGREVFSQSRSRPSRRRQEETRRSHHHYHHNHFLQQDQPHLQQQTTQQQVSQQKDSRRESSSSRSNSTSSNTSCGSRSSESRGPPEEESYQKDTKNTPSPLVYETCLSGSTEVVFDDISDWVVRGLTVRGFDTQETKDYRDVKPFIPIPVTSPTPPSRSPSQTDLESDYPEDGESPARVTKIGNVPIAKYEGSPRRYGQPQRLARPGFPRRVMDGDERTRSKGSKKNPDSSRDESRHHLLHAVDVHRPQVHSSNSLKSKPLLDVPDIKFHDQAPELEEIEPISQTLIECKTDDESDGSLPPPIISTLTSTYGSTFNPPENKEAIEPTSLPDIYESYGFEDSETRKVLEEFFFDSGKKTKQEFFDLEYTLKRQHGNSYVGQRLAECEEEGKDDELDLEQQLCLVDHPQIEDYLPESSSRPMENFCLEEPSEAPIVENGDIKESNEVSHVSDNLSPEHRDCETSLNHPHFYEHSLGCVNLLDEASHTHMPSNIDESSLIIDETLIDVSLEEQNNNQSEEKSVTSFELDEFFGDKSSSSLNQTKDDDEQIETPDAEVSFVHNAASSTSPIKDSDLAMNMDDMRRHKSDSQKNIIEDETSEFEMRDSLQIGVSRNFTLSPETTSCDSLDVESEFSVGEAEGSLHSSGKIVSTMPVLEDGLSSGEESDIEVGPALRSRYFPCDKDQAALMTQQILLEQRQQLLQQQESKQQFEAQKKQYESQQLYELQHQQYENEEINDPDIDAGRPFQKGRSLDDHLCRGELPPLALMNQIGALGSTMKPLGDENFVVTSSPNLESPHATSSPHSKANKMTNCHQSPSSSTLTLMKKQITEIEREIALKKPEGSLRRIGPEGEMLPPSLDLQLLDPLNEKVGEPPPPPAPHPHRNSNEIVENGSTTSTPGRTPGLEESPSRVIGHLHSPQFTPVSAPISGPQLLSSMGSLTSPIEIIPHMVSGHPATHDLHHKQGNSISPSRESVEAAIADIKQAIRLTKNLPLKSHPQERQDKGPVWVPRNNRRDDLQQPYSQNSCPTSPEQEERCDHRSPPPIGQPHMQILDSSPSGASSSRSRDRSLHEEVPQQQPPTNSSTSCTCPSPSHVKAPASKHPRCTCPSPVQVVRPPTLAPSRKDPRCTCPSPPDSPWRSFSASPPVSPNLKCITTVIEHQRHGSQHPKSDKCGREKARPRKKAHSQGHSATILRYPDSNSSRGGFIRVGNDAYYVSDISNDEIRAFTKKTKEQLYHRQPKRQSTAEAPSKLRPLSASTTSLPLVVASSSQVSNGHPPSSHSEENLQTIVDKQTHVTDFSPAKKMKNKFISLKQKFISTLSRSAPSSPKYQRDQLPHEDNDGGAFCSSAVSSVENEDVKLFHENLQVMDDNTLVISLSKKSNSAVNSRNGDLTVAEKILPLPSLAYEDEPKVTGPTFSSFFKKDHNTFPIEDLPKPILDDLLSPIGSVPPLSPTSVHSPVSFSASKGQQKLILEPQVIRPRSFSVSSQCNYPMVNEQQPQSLSTLPKSNLPLKSKPQVRGYFNPPFIAPVLFRTKSLDISNTQCSNFRIEKGFGDKRLSPSGTSNPDFDYRASLRYSKPRVSPRSHRSKQALKASKASSLTNVCTKPCNCRRSSQAKRVVTESLPAVVSEGANYENVSINETNGYVRLSKKLLDRWQIPYETVSTPTLVSNHASDMMMQDGLHNLFDSRGLDNVSQPIRSARPMHKLGCNAKSLNLKEFTVKSSNEPNSSTLYQLATKHYGGILNSDLPNVIQVKCPDSRSTHIFTNKEDGDTDQETDRLLGQQRSDDPGFLEEKSWRRLKSRPAIPQESSEGLEDQSNESSPSSPTRGTSNHPPSSPLQMVPNKIKSKKDKEMGKKKGRSKEVMIHEPAVLIEGVLFRARYLGSTQLVSEGQPTKTTRMMQAEEAVSRIKDSDEDVSEKPSSSPQSGESADHSSLRSSPPDNPGSLSCVLEAPYVLCHDSSLDLCQGSSFDIPHDSSTCLRLDSILDQNFSSVLRDNSTQAFCQNSSQGLCFDSAPEHHQGSTPDLRRDSTPDLRRFSTPDIRQDTIPDLRQDFTPDFCEDSDSDHYRDSTSDIRRNSTPDLHQSPPLSLPRDSNFDLCLNSPLGLCQELPLNEYQSAGNHRRSSLVDQYRRVPLDLTPTASKDKEEKVYGDEDGSDIEDSIQSTLELLDRRLDEELASYDRNDYLAGVLTPSRIASDENIYVNVSSLSLAGDEDDKIDNSRITHNDDILNVPDGWSNYAQDDTKCSTKGDDKCGGTQGNMAWIVDSGGGIGATGKVFHMRFVGSMEVEEDADGGPRKVKRPRKEMVMEAVARIKAPEGEAQPSTEVDLFISTEKIMVLNTDLKEIMMDHALRTISYIADIGDLVVLMARRRVMPTDEQASNPAHRLPKMICHVFESDEAQFIAQSIGQAFQVAYLEFLKANGIEDHSFVKEMDYQEVLNSQEIFGDELQMFAKKELQKEVVVPKMKGEILGVVVVESGWGSMVPTVVIANLSPTGAAAKCGQLNIGDQIIAINGVSLVGLPLSNCQNYIKNTKYNTAVKLTVVPCPPVVEVKIRRPDTKYQLGFSVQNGVICSLLRGGIAERGGVRVGHRIIDINSQSVVAVPHEKIVNLLATSVGEIRMKTMPTSIFRLLTGQESPQYI